MTTQARINDEGIPEHKHPGKPTWHWACAGHYVDGQMTVWDDGEKHRAADAGNPNWPRGSTPDAPKHEIHGPWANVSITRATV